MGIVVILSETKNPVKSRKLRQKITGSFGLLPLRMTGVSGVRMTVQKKRSLGEEPLFGRELIYET
ncbi:hypothetical protein B7990_12345 [Fibrobacter sp. UWB4]|nr:hypothetical protein B7990_12345 [Fibrobacter sp. UWB4]